MSIASSLAESFLQESAMKAPKFIVSQDGTALEKIGEELALAVRAEAKTRKAKPKDKPAKKRGRPPKAKAQGETADPSGVPPGA